MSMMKKMLVLVLVALLNKTAFAGEVIIWTDNDDFTVTSERAASPENDEEYTAGFGFHVLTDYDIDFIFDYRFFTPRDLSTDAPIDGQRPYAAMERIGLGFSNDFLGFIHTTTKVLYVTTGSDLGSEVIQNTVHRELTKFRNDDTSDIDSNDVKGWGSQISNKSGLTD